MTNYKAVYADLSFALPRELIEVAADATKEEKLVRMSFTLLCVLLCSWQEPSITSC
jgi:hypothetical protein